MSARYAKAQASLIDILLLGFFISIALVLGMYTGEQHIQAEITKEESRYAQSMLLAAMNYRNSTYGSYNNVYNLSLAEALDLYYCRGQVTEDDLNTTLKHLLDKLIKPGYNYIFYSRISTPVHKSIKVWKGQPDVEAGYIPIKTFDLKLSCDVGDYYPPMLGIWPEWKKLPRKGNHS